MSNYLRYNFPKLYPEMFDFGRDITKVLAVDLLTHPAYCKREHGFYSNLQNKILPKLEFLVQNFPKES